MHLRALMFVAAKHNEMNMKEMEILFSYFMTRIKYKAVFNKNYILLEQKLLQLLGKICRLLFIVLEISSCNY